MANFPPRAGSGNQSSSQPTGQSTGQPGSGSPAVNPVQTGSGTVTGLRTAGVRPCPSCSTLVNVHATVCPNCGEQIATKEKTIRCRRCRHRASSNLVVCPHCGRDLQPATSRWLTWGLPLLAVFLLSGALVLRAGRGDPASWGQAQVERIVRLVESLTSRLQPDVTISMIPAGQDPNDPLVSQAAQAGADLSAEPAGNQVEVVDVVATSAENTSAATSAALNAGSVAGDAPLVDAAVAVAATAVVSDIALPPAPAEVAPAEPAATATIAPPTATAEPTAEPTAEATATQEPTSTPAGTATGTATATTAATQTATQAPTQAATPSATLAARQVLTRTAAASVAVTVAATADLTRTAATAAAPALTQTASLLGLATPTPVPAQPTEAPTLAATATPAVLAVYEVRRGDTLFEIASEYDVTVEDLLAANSLTEDDVYTIQPGDELNIPAPTPEGAPTATPAPAPATYTVRPGDTLLAIALRSGVTVEDLLAANDMTINDARTLQPGDELLMPGADAPGVNSDATATPTSTGAATSTATPTIAPSPNATPTPENSVRVDAPRLRSPENGTAVSCGGQDTLTWLPVPSVRPTDLYLVNLGYVNSIADGKEEIIWVIGQQRPISAASWQLDNDLCGLAPNTAGKQWRWFVEVVETTTEGFRPVSPASPVWGFTWQ